ncbi:MAG: GGDEF domain-containing protein, partial [Clostridia bacterium]|nr:GGDEF domain-containing protein [Clostridia bacterium]
KEVRTVAGAYNEVHKRRDALDAILRSAAETDALTGVQNRYCYEQYLLELSESDCSGAVFLFDINFLKQTNDTKGHEAGDNLIRAVAECIVDCFGKDCFRLGGDEFAAIVKNCTHESVAEMIKRFESETKKRNVSVSFGWAYTYRIANTNLKFLMNEADQKMYEQKKRIHGNKGLL